MGSVTLRVRSIVWFLTGALLASMVTLMFANAWHADAAPGDTDATFVGITPCRLADTRPAPNRVGPADTLSAGDTQTFVAVGSNGECSIPADAVALSLNVTALGASEQSFLTFWPDGERPLAASLNPAPGQPPVPNAVTVDLSDTGAFDVYNNAGTVNAVIDVNGYYTQASLQELANRLAAVEAEAAANTSSVAALESAQPFTVVSEPIFSVTANAGATDIRQVSVTAPVAGQVAIVASAYMFEGSSGQFLTCGLMDSVTVPPIEAQLLWQAPTGGNYAHLSASRVFDIAAGQTSTYHLVCNAGDGGSLVRAPQVTAIFTPAP